MRDIDVCPTEAASPCAEILSTQPEDLAVEGARLPPRILLVAQPGDACTLYETALQRSGVQVDTVAAIDTFYSAVTHFAYNGIVIDIPTKIKALSDHKDLVYSILGRFPVIQVNIDPRMRRIRALLYGQHQPTGELEDLIRQHCWHTPPRKLRSEERKPLHYNVLLSTQRQFDPQTLIRTVTMDVSLNGCFLFSSARFQIGARVWMRIMDLYDKTPISGIVRHKRNWGEALIVPGIGVEFESIKAGQRRALFDPIATAARNPVPHDNLFIGGL